MEKTLEQQNKHMTLITYNTNAHKINLGVDIQVNKQTIQELWAGGMTDFEKAFDQITLAMVDRINGQYMTKCATSITCVEFLSVLHVFYHMCNTCIYHTPVLHMYFSIHVINV